MNQIVHNMDAADYHAVDAVSASRLKLAGKSGLAYKYGFGEPSSSMQLGTLVHLAVLEPDEFAQQAVVYDGTRRGKAWDEFAGEHAGRIILSRSEWDAVRGMADAVFCHEAARDLLAMGQAEVSLFWDEDGTPAKARLDKLGDGLVLDLKTARDISPRVFSRASATLEYHLQMAWYVDGAKRCGFEATDVGIIAVTNTKPYDCGVYYLGHEELEAGRKLYRERLEMVRGWQETGVYPGAVPYLTRLELPDWAYGRADVALTWDGEEV